MTKKRILVVDDEKDFVAMLKLRLEANGYEVIPAFDGIQGVLSAKREKPDLIMLDVMMPAGGGYIACEGLQKSSDTRSIPIIFLTAKSQSGDVAKAYSVGGKYYLTKPYEPELLLETVKEALELSE
jgi:DNA-binding response OmpR family regulator